MKKGIFLVIALLALAGNAGATAVTDSLTASDAAQINRSSPVATRTDLGTRLRGPLTTGATTYAAGSQYITDALQNVYATPTTTVFLKTTGAGSPEAYYLGDGVYNQRLSVVLVTDGGKDFYVTPKTVSGFTNVQLNDAKDTVTLKYINDTVGWIVESNNGATVN